MCLCLRCVFARACAARAKRKGKREEQGKRTEEQDGGKTQTWDATGEHLPPICHSFRILLFLFGVQSTRLSFLTYDTCSALGGNLTSRTVSGPLCRASLEQNESGDELISPRCMLMSGLGGFGRGVCAVDGWVLDG